MSFKIGNITIPNKTVLAPMAGINCTAFRLQCKNYGCGLIFTQMYKVSTIIEKYNEDSSGKNLLKFLNIIYEKESPVAIQLVGNTEDNWEEVIEILNKDVLIKVIDIIDINFGCPEKDIHKIKAGGYLASFPDDIRQIIRVCKRLSNKPITAKIRSGWDNNNINALEICKILINEKIDGITIHPRTVKQKYSGKSDWTIIKEVKNYCIENSIKIPIIGNGDILLPGNAKAIIEQTKCDAVMLGRVAMKNPEIFEYVNYILEHGKNKEKFNKDTKQPIKLIKEFIELYENFENRNSLNEVKNHISWYLTETKEKKILKKINDCESIQDIKVVLFQK